MPVQPDRHPGTREEVEVKFEDQASITPENGIVGYKTGVGFRFYEEGVEKGLTGSGISETQHKVLRQLIHFIEEGPAEGFVSGAYKESLPSGNPFPTSIIWWESSSKLKKIVERLVTWTGASPTTDQWKIYDTDGTTVLWIVTDTISYSGPFETTRTRAIAAGP
jgi:hypothetical protein